MLKTWSICGTVSPAEKKNRRLGIGLEKLDRNLYNPDSVFPEIRALGVSWVRIQSGWMRTEKEKGVYDFSWLDHIVDSLFAQGVTPWMCLCYGNPIYSEEAKNVNGAIGVPPIFTAEEKAGWRNYVQKTAEHFSGRIRHWEVWNEPDCGCWRHGPNPIEYGEFVAETGRTLKAVNPENQVFAGSLTFGRLDYLSQMLSTGCWKYIDAITYHNYKARHFEDDILGLVQDMKALVDTYDPHIAIIQGEHGAPSRGDGRGGLSNFSWTEEKQAKYLSRAILTDLMSGVEFASYFTMVDIFENLEGEFVEINESNYGFYGLLREGFENGKPSGVYTKKPSYRAVQTLASLLSGDVEKTNAPIRFAYPEHASDIWQDVDNAYYIQNDCRTIFQSFCRKNGSVGFVYWKATDVINMTYSSEVTIEAYRLPQEVHLINCLTGDIYDIPSDKTELRADGRLLLKNLPIYDYPLMVTFGNFTK